MDSEVESNEVVLKNILVAATGTPAAANLLELCNGLGDLGQVKVICTPSALHFLDRTTLANNFQVYTNEDQWRLQGPNVPLYSYLSGWAHALVIAPLSANTLAKMAAGVCDNLLTTVVKMWEYPHEGGVGKPMLMFPDMEFLWNSLSTQDHIDTLLDWGATLAQPHPDGRMFDTAGVVGFVQQNLK